MQVIKKLVCCIMLILVFTCTNAEDLRSVTVIMPYQSGGNSTSTFTHLQKWVLTKKKINLIALYKPGANGSVAMFELVRSKTDGSVVSIVTTNILDYQLKQDPNLKITKISKLHSLGAPTLVVSANSNINSLNDFLKTLDSENISIGYVYSEDIKTFIDNLSQYFSKNKGFIDIPFNGAAQVKLNLLGNHIKAALLNYSVIYQELQDGKLIAIATTDPVPDQNLHVFRQLNKDLKIPVVNSFELIAPGPLDKDALTLWTEIINEYKSDPEVIDFYQQRYQPIIVDNTKNSMLQ
jgi:tripartite-type tricarboxylate transporter receptor subunit TctC